MNNTLAAARLLGRGGAAFPTGTKWQAVAARPPGRRFVVCNADESEPGTFKDRVLMEGDPFAVVEALTIAGFAVGAERGFIYLRGEYPVATARIEGAIVAARAAGLLGADVAGAGFAFEIEIRQANNVELQMSVVCVLPHVVDLELQRLGTIGELGHLIHDRRPDEVLIAIPSASGELRERIRARSQPA